MNLFNVSKKLIAPLMMVSMTGCVVNNKVVNNQVTPHKQLILDGKIFTAAWMQHSAEYKALCMQAYNIATERIDQLVKNRRPGDSPLAIVTDVDETILDNSPSCVKDVMNGKDFNKGTWNAWCDCAEADALEGAVKFFNHAAKQGVAVFYITNRDEINRSGTLENLQRAGFPMADNEHLLLRSNTSNKDERRSLVSEKYEIVMYLGDNLGDFSHVYDSLDEKVRLSELRKDESLFGRKFIVLPNPNYGTWLKVLINGAKTEEEKAIKIKDSLRSF